MSLHAIIVRRRDALISAWVRDPLVQVQVESPTVLPRLAFIDDSDGEGTTAALGRRSVGNVAIATNGAGTAFPDVCMSCWVAASYGGYRSAYLAFIRQAYGVKATASDLAGFDVDHLLNRARSPLDTTFIRIEAIPAAANQEWGRLFEKAASHPDFYANQKRERRTMSYMICAKLAGQSPPLGPNDAAGVNRLTQYFVSIGLSLAESRQGVQSMLDFAYKFR